MYLARLGVRNFRCLRNVDLDFTPGLNVIVGENNTGKTALIDAMRLVYGLGHGRRDIYATDDDLWHSPDGSKRADTLDIDAHFHGLSTRECGLFSECLAPTEGEGCAQIHVRFEASGSGQRRPRFFWWGGELEGEAPPAYVMDGLLAVYLEPLRDPAQGLRPSRGSRIAKLLEILAGDESEKQALVDAVQEANKAIEADPLVARAAGQINSRLGDITGPAMAQTAELKLAEPEFRRIAESVRALIGSQGHFEVDENGLGYNNLLYTATVLSELQRAGDVDMASLLVEEPEAHLHPHLQVLLVDYLQKACELGTADETEGEEVEEDTGERNPVQVVLTTHSPVLASRAPLDSVAVLHRDTSGEIGAATVRAAALDDAQKQDLSRYLDVTKAQLFFAHSVLLVEGISEAFILPELARQLGRPLEQHGVSVVNIQSLAFRPFAGLFREGGLSVRAAMVTDADNRKQADELADGSFRAFVATRTLEWDLVAAGNADLVLEAYEYLHPQVAVTLRTKMGAAASDDDAADLFCENLSDSDKGRLAQRLAALIADGNEVRVPEYIADAITYVAGNEDADAC